MKNGFILWQGPSAIDGAPIVVIVTGVIDGGSNTKTGPMSQVYIMRSDMKPLTAAAIGCDVSICGRCRHRGRMEVIDGELRLVERTCYVNLSHGPRVVFDAFLRGRYEEEPPKVARRMLAHREVRFGAYGDPGAVPAEVWAGALKHVRASNAYTHMWRERPDLASFCMASCDTEEERLEAKALGFRTFRVRTAGAPLMKGEGHCPASDEVKTEDRQLVQCQRCMLCDGRRRALKVDITIEAHGSGAAAFERQEAARLAPQRIAA